VMPIEINVPGVSEVVRCDYCRFVWDQIQDGRRISMCTRWRRKAGERCGEYLGGNGFKGSEVAMNSHSA
jgi:hypothetical protein